MLNIWNSLPKWYRSHVVDETENEVVLEYMKCILTLHKVSGYISKHIINVSYFKNDLSSKCYINTVDNIVIEDNQVYDSNGILFHMQNFIAFIAKLQEDVNRVYDEHNYPVMYLESYSRIQAKIKQKEAAEKRKQELLDNPNSLKLKHTTKKEKNIELPKESEKIVKTKSLKIISVGKVYVRK